MKKINILNIIFGFACLIVYMFFMLKNGSKYVDVYSVESLYLGASFSIVFILFAFFKKIRNSIWMDIIYMLYLLLFVIGNFLAINLGKTKKLYGVFMCYPSIVKYLVIIVLVINLLFFILSFGGKKDE